jgi:hypothetical protein
LLVFNVRPKGDSYLLRHPLSFAANKYSINLPRQQSRISGGEQGMKKFLRNFHAQDLAGISPTNWRALICQIREIFDGSKYELSKFIK